MSDEKSSSPTESTADEPDQPPQVTVQLHAAATPPPDLPWLQDRLRRICDLLNLSGGSISIIIVDDAYIRRLHDQYLGVDATTDVLSFDLRDELGSGGASINGEIYVCLDEAARQSADRGHPMQHELLLYALHGLLHLLGYDDHEAQAHQAMHEREDQLLAAIGVGPVFADCGGKRK